MKTRFGNMFIKTRGTNTIVQNQRFLDTTDKMNVKITTKLLDYADLEPCYRCNMGLTKAKFDLVKLYGETALRGYGIFVSGVNEMPLEHIERIDELGVYEDDLEASEQAEKDGIKILETHFVNEPFCYYNGTIIDTEENRKMLENIQSENEYFR